MSESQEAAGLQAGANADSGASAGTLLREAREAAGLHIAAMAVALKVPVRKLEALEAGQYDQLPDAVFTRALAASVCRALKVDATPILERLPQTAAPRLDHEETSINAPFRTPGEAAGQSWVDQLTRPVFLAVFALLLGALVLILLPNAQRDASGPAEAAVSAVPPATPGPGPATMPVAISAAPTTPPDPVSTAPTVAPSAEAPAQPAAPVAAPAPAVGPAAPAAPAAQAVAAPVAPASASSTGSATGSVADAAGVAPANGIVVFRTRGESWVEVTDAKGVVTLRRTLAAGEAVGASGALPLSVIVGRADVTAVQVRGKPLDVVPLARDNVARFEVK